MIDFLKKIFTIIVFAILLQNAFAFSTDGEPVKGDDSAILKIFWFNNFTSSQDKEFYLNTLPQIELDLLNNGNVQFIAKDFFTGSVNGIGEKAHEAAQCAFAQGKYWEYSKKLYENQPEWTVNGRQLLTQYANDLGLNASAFDSCVDNSTYYGEISADKNEATANGIISPNTISVGTARLNVSGNYSTISSTVKTEFEKIAPVIAVLQPNGTEIISGNYNIFVKVSDQNRGSLKLDLGYSSAKKGNFSNILTDFSLTNPVNCPQFSGNSGTAFACLAKIWNTREIADGNYYINARVRGDFNSSIDVSDSNFLIDNTVAGISSNIPASGDYSNKADQNIEVLAQGNGAGINVSATDFNVTQDGRKISGNVSSSNMENNQTKLTFKPATAYSDGKKVDVNVTVKDLAGNSSSIAFLFYIDLNAPSQIIDLSADIVSGNAIQLNWTASVDKNSGLKEYRIYRKNYSINGSNKGDPYAIITTNSFLDSNVFDKETYYYIATAVDNAGNESPLGNQATILFKTFDNQQPAINVIYPAINGFSNRQDQNITLKIQDDVSGIDPDSLDYNVLANNSKISMNVSKTLSADGKTLDVVLKPVASFLDNQMVDVSIAAKDNRDNNALIIFYFIVDLNRPNKISDLNADSRNSVITLKWSPSIDSNSGINSYRIYKSTGFITESSKPADFRTIAGTTFVDSDLAMENYYYYAVTAIDNAGNESMLSNHVFIQAKESEIEISPQSASANMLRNDTISLNFTVKNNTSGKTCINLDTNVSSNRIEAQLSQNSVCLNAKSQTAATLSVSSKDAGDGFYTIKVIGENQNYQSVAIATIAIGDVDDIIFDTGYQSVCLGGTGTINVGIENKGPTRKLSLRAENEIFIPAFNPSTIILNSGEKRYVELKVSSTSAFSKGDYSINVYAFDETGKKEYKSNVLFKLNNCNLEKEATFELNVPSSCYALDKNTEMTSSFKIKNLLNAVQAVNIAITSDLSVGVEENSFDLEPLQEKTISFSVKSRIDDAAGNHKVRVYAWNYRHNISKEACVRLYSTNALSLEVVENDLEIERGKFDVFKIIVKNIGDWNSAFNLGIENRHSAIRAELSDDNFSLDFGKTMEVYAIVSPSANASLGEYSLTIVANISGKTEKALLNFKVTEAKPNYLEILSYPEKVAIAMGGKKTIALVLANNTDEKIENLKFQLKGFSSNISLEPKEPITLKAGETRTEEITINVKEGKAGMQVGKLEIGNRLTKTSVPLKVFVQITSAENGMEPQGMGLAGLISFGSSIVLGLIALLIITSIIVFAIGNSKGKQPNWIKNQ